MYVNKRQNIALQSKFTYQVFWVISVFSIQAEYALIATPCMRQRESYLSASKNCKTGKPWKEPVFVILKVYLKQGYHYL